MDQVESSIEGHRNGGGGPIETKADTTVCAAPFRLGDVRVLPARNLLVAGEAKVVVEPKMMDLLCVLAAHPREVETRDELIHETWHVDYGGDESLSRAISLLRKAFRDLGIEDQVIETIPRRGYRLLVDPEPEADTPDEPAPTLRRAPATASAPQRRWWPIAVVLVVGIVAAALLLRPSLVGGIPVTDASAVAVLPFSPGKGEDDGFADSLAEGVVARLATLPDLRVPAMLSGETVPATQAELEQLGRRLGVSHLLSGSVRRQDDRIRVTAQLISVEDGDRVWAQTFENDDSDPFAAQDRMAEQIVAAIEDVVQGSIARPPADAGTESRAAWRAYREGRRALSQRGPDLARAIERFEEAVAADPDFAQALAALASAHAFSAADLHVRPEIADSRAGSFARRALAIDDGLAEPHAALGRVACSQGRWEDAIASFDTALARDPDNALALTGKAEALLHLGYARKARETAERAIRADPRDALARQVAGQAAQASGALSDADREFRAAQSMGHGPADLGRALLLAQSGEADKAASLMATAFVHDQMITEAQAEGAAATFARIMTRKADPESALRPYPVLADDPGIRAMAFLLAGRRREALDLLREDHAALPLLWANLDPALLSSPEFETFASETKLADYWQRHGYPDRLAQARRAAAP
ncbi:winged helix-turn-helix domain-containing protein [Sphingomicrobium nitratireducens]|uniref:winged helix-turn-helix domain-containing protein n=1 Tax=Sphingomicrobium nitratireducens TaxID=2964666 RepID=UPI002240BAF5